MNRVNYMPEPGSPAYTPMLQTFSRCVQAGTLLFVSGVSGFHYDTRRIDPDPAAQLEQALQNAARDLHGAGCAIADTVMLRLFFTERSHMVGPVQDVLDRWFRDVHPAVTVLRADMMHPDMKVEVEITASRAESVAVKTTA